MKNIDTFAAELSVRALNYREEPFRLHSGGSSNWLVDCKAGLGNGRLLRQAGGLMAELAKQQAMDFDLVFGWGLGGSLAVSLMMMGSRDESNSLSLRGFAHDEEDELTFTGRIHLERRAREIAGSNALLVDDVATTGSSFIQMADRVKQEGGQIKGALAVVDRSKGMAELALANMGIRFAPLLELDEASGRLWPANNA